MILTSQENIRKWTEAGAWGSRTLIDFFMDHVKKDPDKVCLVDPMNKEALTGSKPERLTYGFFYGLLLIISLKFLILRIINRGNLFGSLST